MFWIFLLAGMVCVTIGMLAMYLLRKDYEKNIEYRAYNRGFVNGYQEGFNDGAQTKQRKEEEKCKKQRTVGL